MEIPEVSIENTEQKAKRKKKFSKKIVKASQEYLQQWQLDPEQLTDSQLTHVYKYVSTKRMLKWSIPITLFSAVIMISGGLWAFFTFANPEGFSTDRRVLVINAEGNEQAVELAQVSYDNIRMQKTISFMFGAVVAASMYLGAFNIVNSIVSMISSRQKKKIIEAFLPEVGIASKTIEYDTFRKNT